MVSKKKGYTNLGIFIFVANTYSYLWVVSPCLLGYPIAQPIRALQNCAKAYSYIEFEIITCTLSPIYKIIVYFQCPT